MTEAWNAFSAVDLVENGAQVGLRLLGEALESQMWLREEEVEAVELLLLRVGQGNQLVVGLRGQLNLPRELLLFLVSAMHFAAELLVVLGEEILAKIK